MLRLSPQNYARNKLFDIDASVPFALSCGCLPERRKFDICYGGLDLILLEYQRGTLLNVSLRSTFLKKE